MKKLIQTSVLALAITFLFHAPVVKADDSATTKVENTASDAKTDTKKAARKGARKMRKATGNDTMGKDAKDKVNDAKDSMDNSSQKMKNKADHG